MTPTLVLQCSDDVIAPRAVGEYVHRQIRGSDARPDGGDRALPEPERARGDHRRDQRRSSSRRRCRRMADGRRRPRLRRSRRCSRRAPRSSTRTRPRVPLDAPRTGLIVKVNETLPGLDRLPPRGPRRPETAPRPARAGRADLLRDSLRPAAADAGPASGRSRSSSSAPTARRLPALLNSTLVRDEAGDAAGHPHDRLRRLGPAPVRAGAAARARRKPSRAPAPRSRSRTSTMASCSSTLEGEVERRERRRRARSSTSRRRGRSGRSPSPT